MSYGKKLAFGRTKLYLFCCALLFSVRIFEPVCIAIIVDVGVRHLDCSACVYFCNFFHPFWVGKFPIWTKGIMQEWHRCRKLLRIDVRRIENMLKCSKSRGKS